MISTQYTHNDQSSKSIKIKQNKHQVPLLLIVTQVPRAMFLKIGTKTQITMNFSFNKVIKIHTNLHILSIENPLISKKNKPRFETSKIYACLAVEEDRDITSEDAQIDQNLIVINEDIETSSPLPIKVNGINNFVRLRTKLIKLIGSEKFLFKSSTYNLKNSVSIIRFLSDEGAEYHNYYQQLVNKAFCVVI